MRSENESSLSHVALKIWPERLREFTRGAILYWQGDPVDHIYVLVDGAVKISSISQEGRIHSFGILGSGRLIGARPYLLGGVYESVAEVLETSNLIVIAPRAFDHALSSNPTFSGIVMRELAREASEVSHHARDLSFLHVQERLKRSLANLAKEHGIPTTRGVRIDLDITQEEIGALVAANRTTIASCLTELRAQGLLWKEGRRLVIIPPEHMELLDSITAAVIDGDDTSAEELTRKAITAEIEGLKVLGALTQGMREIDRSYTHGDVDLPEVVLAATAMKDCVPLVEAAMETGRRAKQTVGSVIIGTVFGDIHDIGKNIVGMLLRSRAFDVVDLGVNVPAREFTDAIRRYSPDILALSTSTSATCLEIKTIMNELVAHDLRGRVKVMVGGGAMSAKYAGDVGADGYHATARGAVELAWRFVTEITD